MVLALLALAVVAIVLALPTLAGVWSNRSDRRAERRRSRRRERLELHDPGRERRAEQRARELLRSCVNEEEWAMYRDLGFIRVSGRLQTDGPHGLSTPRRRLRGGAPETGSGPAQQRTGARGAGNGADRQPPYA